MGILDRLRRKRKQDQEAEKTLIEVFKTVFGDKKAEEQINRLELAMSRECLERSRRRRSEYII